MDSNGAGVTTSVKARFSNGVLTPLEPLDLEEGKEVMVSIADAHPRIRPSTHCGRRGSMEGDSRSGRVAAQHLLRSPGELAA